MSNELTEAETDMLEAAYDFDFDSMVKVVGAIVATREAAARREALLEAADALPRMTEGDERIGTRRFPPLRRDAYSLAIEEAQGALRALAEPERDEEGGR